MVDFKILNLWIFLIASLVLSGCVPQAKQTECSTNEAFSPTQRRCLPVNPSETSFIKIKSPVPTGGITMTASSGSPLTFTVMLENPYNRSYRMRWLRNFNGTQFTIHTPSSASANISDHPYSISLVPSGDLFGAVGNHIITAQILDANSNNVIDSHDFTLQLTNDPTPNGQSFSPSLSFPVNQNPINSTMTFSFSVLNNSREMSMPRLRWRLVKLTGTAQPDLEEIDSLINTNSPQNVDFIFNPANPMRNGVAPTAPFSDFVGQYRLEASIMDGAINFSTYSWSINLLHPDLGFVFNSHTPVPGDGSSTIRAFNGIAYSDLTPSNFSYFNNSVRSQFCVQVSDGDGRYGNGVFVRYYLGNSTGHVYQGLTSGGDDEICLSDAPAPTQNAIVFSDSNPELTWSTSISARVFDAQTGEEYTRYDAGAYPLKWNIVVEPVNKAPVLTFVDNVSTVVCGATIGTVRNNCQITQSNDTINNTLTVAFQITDEHYTDSAQFAYTATLSRGSTVVDSSCQKAFGVAGGPVFSCNFTVPSYDAIGSINPTLDAWKVAVNVSDSGSPYSPGNQKTSSLIWNLDVQEINYRPIISSVNTYLAAASTTTFTEKETAIFQVNLTDPERDEYIIELARCGATLADSDCTTLMTTTRTYLNSGDYLINRRLAYTIPDGFLTANTLSANVLFRLKVINYASTAGALNQLPNEAISSINLTINNYNPAPVFANTNALDTVAPSLPDPLGIDYMAFGSFPLTLDPATVTDASEMPAEAVIEYQWWIAPYSVTPTWSEIVGANSRLLRWTPGTTMASGNYLIKLCATDGYPPRASIDPNFGGSYCNNPAIVAVHNNFLSMASISTTTGNFVTGAPAVWIDTTATGVVPSATGNSRIAYSAYVVDHRATSGSFRIHVQKSVYNVNGTGEMQILAEMDFDAIDPVEHTADFNIYDVKDLRIVGDNNSLYIAYIANFENFAHSLGYRPEIRRIFKGTTRGQKTAPNLHGSPFAFNYQGFFVDHSQALCSACWNGANSANDLQVTGGSITLDTSNFTSGSTIELGYAAGSYPLTITPTGVDSTNLAINITNAINAHAQLGFTAVHSGASSVIIYGPVANEEARIQQHTNKLGQIWMDASYLYVPYINLSQAVPNNKVISVERVQNDSSQSLWNVANALGGMTSTLLAGTYSNDFDNAIDRNGNVLFAYANNGGQGNLIKFTGANFATGINYSILPTRNVQKIRISASNAANDFYYVMGQAGDESIAITRLESDLTVADFNRVWTLEAIGPTDFQTAALVSSLAGNIYDFAIQTASLDTYSVSSIAEARILISSTLGLFAFKTKTDNTVSCGSCEPISRSGSTVSPLAPLLGISNLVINQTIGTPGNISPTNNENTRDIMAFTYIDSSVADENILRLGVINSERVQINSTTQDLINGFFTPAIFKY